ncbi:MAG TPA: flagellar basal body L-ring protein FlgH [Dissulfurispiraceae bacterium]|nr:flagellar basal body L-ring protein FlgH [Dissulfurispiraceae bacterium]
MKKCPLILVGALLIGLLLNGCNGLKEAKEIREAPMPPRYFETKQNASPSTEGSLWHERKSLFVDSKSSQVNDLVTILITEKTTATKKATTNTAGDSKAEYTVSDLFNADLDFGLQKFPLIKDQYSAGKLFAPHAKGSSSSAYKGSGDTARQGTLTATITAKVIEVLPNGNLVLESRKEIILNNEKEIIVLRGIVRPDDISTNNTVLSQYVADAQIYMVGDGVINDKQSPGWLVRFLDSIWPF